MDPKYGSDGLLHYDEGLSERKVVRIVCNALVQIYHELGNFFLLATVFWHQIGFRFRSESGKPPRLGLRIGQFWSTVGEYGLLCFLLSLCYQHQLVVDHKFVFIL
jgi:hypothetical protein